MGDRGNIVIRQEKDTNRGDVWFYSHWSGSNLKSVVQSALAKHWRWTDASYLARIIFDELVGKHHGEETSFGISTTLQDNEYPIVVVDCPEQRVYEIAQKLLDDDNRLPAAQAPTKSWSFEQFAQLNLDA